MERYFRKTIILSLAMSVCFAMLASLTVSDVQAAAKKPAVAKKTTVALNGTKTLKIKKNGYRITKVVSVKSAKKKIAKAKASKSKITVYGIKKGKAKITVKVKARKGKKKKTFSLVTKATVKNPAATLSSKSMYVGEMCKVKLTNAAKGAKVTYTSANPLVASVNGGKVAAKYQGSAAVKVKVVLKKTKYAKKKTKTLNAGTVSVKLDMDKLIGNMTLEQKISQMIMPSARAWEGDYLTDLSKAPAVSQALRKHQYGGIILFGQNIDNTEQTARLVSALQVNNAQDTKSAVIPYMVSLDQEGGAVNRLSIGTRGTGSMAIGATGAKAEENAAKTGEFLGKEMSSLGFNVNLGPCIDMIADLNDPGWSTRVFSDDTATVSRLGQAFKSGVDKSNVITTYKHFPGNGDGSDYPTATDITKTQLQQKGLRTYKDAVDNGAEMIMISATTFPLIDDQQTMADGKTKGYYPASISKKIVTGILRGELGYNGVVITDALEMDQFIYEPTNFEPKGKNNIKLFSGTAHTVGHDLQVAEKAINAGCDILLLPTDMNDSDAVTYYDKYISGIEDLVRKGKISEKTVDAAVKRILTLKQKRGIFGTDVKGEKIEQVVANAKKIVGAKKHHDIEKQIAKEAVTLYNDDGNVIPVSKEKIGKEQINVLFICNSKYDATPVRYALDQLMDSGKLARDTKIENRISNDETGSDDAAVQIVIDRFNSGEDGLVYSRNIKNEISEADVVICLSKISPLSSPGEIKANGKMRDVVGKALAEAKTKGKKSILLSTNLPSDASYFKNNEDANKRPDAIVCSYLSAGFGVDPTAKTSGSENVGAFNANVPAAIYGIFGESEFTGTMPVELK